MKQMKKILYLSFAFCLGLMIVGCKRAGGPFEIALVTDVGTISDQSFNQAAWTGVKRYGDEFKVTYQYYQPTCTGAGCEVQNADRIRAIDTAISGGAKVIVLPGFLFGDIIDSVADANASVKFIGIDVSPANVKTNVRGIHFRDYESGFVAGYSTVIEGYTKVGFMGGLPVPAVQQYGTGFIAGTMYGADEKNIADFTFPDDRYVYLNSFMPDPTHKSKASAWYTAGTEAIFVAAGGAGLSVNEAAVEAKKQMIGVDVDQSYLSAYILTSAMKKMEDAVYTTLKDYRANNFQGGNVTLGVKEGGSGIAPMSSSRFKVFTQAQLDAIYGKISDGSVAVPSTYDQLVTFLSDLGYSTGDYPAKATVEPAPATS
jgi:basic membrane protein A